MGGFEIGVKVAFLGALKQRTARELGEVGGDAARVALRRAALPLLGLGAGVGLLTGIGVGLGNRAVSAPEPKTGDPTVRYSSLQARPSRLMAAGAPSIGFKGPWR